MGFSRIQALLLVSTIALVFLVGIFAERAHAEEPPSLVWEARYNHPYSEDWGKAAVTDDAGNTYVTGTGYGYLGNPDYLTVKYDPSGAEIWKAHYGSYHINFECRPSFPPVSEIPTDIGLDGAGNVYVTGTARYGAECGLHGEGYSHLSTITVKYDTNGNQVWIADSAGEAAAMAVDEDGNVFVVGTLYEFDLWGFATPVSYVTAKFDTRGANGCIQPRDRHCAGGSGLDPCNGSKRGKRNRL